jgi:hypothetical protein
VSFADGIVGEAARFDGTAGHIRLGADDVGNLGVDATIAFWFYADASNFASTASHRILSKDAGAFWTFGLSSAGLAVNVRGANLPGPPQAAFELGDPEDFTEIWTAVALRKTGSTFDLFINGESVGTRATTIGIVFPNAAVSFGNLLSSNSQFFAGLIDETRFYDRALSNWEIARLADPSYLVVPLPAALQLMLCGAAVLALIRRAHQPLAYRRAGAWNGVRPAACPARVARSR